jgi:hypothetical protein
MNSNQLWMTAQTPSGFGMPISGHTFGMCTPAADRRSATTIAVRDRVAGAAAATKREMGLAQSFPGTSAWRPPTC